MEVKNNIFNSLKNIEINNANRILTSSLNEINEEIVKKSEDFAKNVFQRNLEIILNNSVTNHLSIAGKNKK
jgi:hypothetical protein